MAARVPELLAAGVAAALLSTGSPAQAQTGARQDVRLEPAATELEDLTVLVRPATDQPVDDLPHHVAVP